MARKRQVLGLAWKIALGTLGAVATFATVASLFGGGWQGYLAAAIGFLVVFGLAILLARHEASVSGGPGPSADERPGLDEQEETAPRTSGLVCDPGPYEVDGGSMLEIELDVRKGERVQGHLAEVDDDDFDWRIVNERNLVALRNDEDFNEVRGEDHVSATSARWKVSQDGPWFLVLDTYGRSNPRIVRVSLRRH